MNLKNKSCLIIVILFLHITLCNHVAFAKGITIETPKQYTENDVIVGDLYVKNDIAIMSIVKVEGNLYLSKGKISLLGGKLEVNGKLIQSGGTIECNNASIDDFSLFVKGDYIQEGGLLDMILGGLFINGSYRIETMSKDESKGMLRMVTSDGYITVAGDFVMHSIYSHRNYLTRGTLEVRGNFTQKCGNKENFYTYGSHTVILAGEDVEKNNIVPSEVITFESTKSKFCYLKVNKPIEAYIFKLPNGESLEEFSKPQGKSIKVDGFYLDLDVEPVVIKGRLLVPLRQIFEALDGTVKWFDKSKEIKGSKNASSIELKINSNIAKVNGKIITLDVPPQIISGRTLVPIRVVAESLGAEVNWDESTQTVEIYP